MAAWRQAGSLPSAELSLGSGVWHTWHPFSCAVSMPGRGWRGLYLTRWWSSQLLWLYIGCIMYRECQLTCSILSVLIDILHILVQFSPALLSYVIAECAPEREKRSMREKGVILITDPLFSLLGCYVILTGEPLLKSLTMLRFQLCSKKYRDRERHSVNLTDQCWMLLQGILSRSLSPMPWCWEVFYCSMVSWLQIESHTQETGRVEIERPNHRYILFCFTSGYHLDKSTPLQK